MDTTNPTNDGCVCQEPQVSGFSGFNLRGWFSLNEDVIWRGEECYARVMASGDVAHIAFDREIGEYKGGVNWAVVIEATCLDTVLNGLDAAAAYNGGWLDYSQVIGWTCTEDTDFPG
jgi:hypothetical protein